MNKQLEKIFESKKKYHRQMADLPFEEKLKILDKLGLLAQQVKNTVKENESDSNRSRVVHIP